MRYKLTLSFTLIILVVLMLVGSQTGNCNEIKTKPEAELTRNSTNWKIEPSFKFDVLTFLNSLTGDSYYLHYYQDEYNHFEPLLTTEAREALANLKKKIKDDGGGIISAFLCLYFSATDDETLDDMLKTLEDTKTLQNNLRATTYYSDGKWMLFESVTADLKTVFMFLQEIEFRKYWLKTVRPQLLEGIGNIRQELPSFDVILELESVFKSSLPTDTITVYMQYFSQPHGIKITGSRFLTDVAWPFSIVIRNSVHEMMHPPYDYTNDSVLRAALDQLKEDSFLMEKVENHNPSFGYNTFDGFIEEDVVQALDQVINERLGSAIDARHRWKRNDDGMHVFAVALYNVMLEEEFAESDENLRTFLIQQIVTGNLKPGKLKSIYDKFYGVGSEQEVSK